MDAIEQKQELFDSLRDILSDITEDWDIDMDEVSPDTQLLDLGLESISLVYLIAELQQEYSLGDELFRKMRAEGTLLKEMSVDDVLSAIMHLLENKTQGTSP